MIRHSKIIAFAIPAFSLGCSSSAMAATCTVPNQITNGQIGDANKVMGNFNAVADCAQTVVTTTGTPATGAIAVFSGNQAITSGNLVGDATTAGSTGTSLSSTGVPAKTYSNPTVSIDAKGRIVAAANSSGAGGLWWFLPPSASQFTAASGDGVLPTISDDSKVGMILTTTAPGPASDDRYRLAYKTLPTGSWQVITRLTLDAAGVSYQGGGLVAYESSTGKILGLTTFSNGLARITTMRYGTLTSYGGDLTLWNTFDSTLWAKLTYNSTSGMFSGYISADGKNWVLLNTTSKSSVFTGNADRVGIAVFNTQGSNYGIPIAVSVANWQQSW